MSFIDVILADITFTLHLDRICEQDLASQIYYWDCYKAEMKRRKQKRGKFVPPELAEYMAGVFSSGLLLILFEHLLF